MNDISILLNKKTFEKNKERYIKVCKEKWDEDNGYLIEGRWYTDEIEFSDGNIIICGSTEDDHFISVEVKIDEDNLLLDILKFILNKLNKYKEVLKSIGALKEK